MTGNRKNIYSNRYGETNSWGLGFIKILLIWDGGAIKLIWHELLAFLLLYFALSILYREVFIYNEYQRELFELLCMYASRFAKLIPVSFMTGFYVANVVTRYWNQFLSLAWPDRLAFRLVAFIPGSDIYHRTIRRTVARYINLSTLLVYRLVSNKVEQDFPTYESLVDAGLLTPEEAKLLENIDNKTPYDTTWTPILWTIHLIQKERSSGRLQMDPPIYANLISSFDYLESCNRSILNYAWVNIPLAYTQVATLSVYAYLFSSIFARQFLEPRGTALDSTTFKTLNVTTSDKSSYIDHTPVIYLPIFPILEFICYLGWVKMAEALLNPWGDDDDDFQISYLIDRNFQTTFLIVDEALTDLEIIPDIFMDENVPFQVKKAKQLDEGKKSFFHGNPLTAKDGMQSGRQNHQRRPPSKTSSVLREMKKSGERSRTNDKRMPPERTVSTALFTMSHRPSSSESVTQIRSLPKMKVDNIESHTESP